MGFRTRPNFHAVRSALQPLPPGRDSPITAHTLAGTGKLFILSLLYFLGEQMCPGTSGSVPQGGPFTLMEIHKWEGWTRGELGSTLPCTGGWGDCFYLGYGVYKVTLLLPSSQQVPEGEEDAQG